MQNKTGTNKRQFLWQVCGHGKITDYLKSSILNNHVAHAYVFAGAGHLGKKTTASRFIKSLFCPGKGEYAPCNDCPACRQIDSQAHPDVYYLRRVINDNTGKLNRDITIDQVRALKARLSQTTLLRGWKVAVIEEAESLNDSSANALLKVLEEPTPKTVIILITSDISRLPKTIISRSLVLNFLPVNRVEIKNYLLSREINEDKAEKISRLALGRPGIALGLADDSEALGATLKNLDDFHEMYQSGLSDRLKNMEAVISWEKDESLNIKKLKQLLDTWRVAVRDLLLLMNQNEAGLANIRSAAAAAKLQAIDPARILNADLLITEAKKMFDCNISSKNILENILINL